MYSNKIMHIEDTSFIIKVNSRSRDRVT